MNTAINIATRADTFLKSLRFVDSDIDLDLLCIELQSTTKIPSTPEEIEEFFRNFLTQNYLDVPADCKPTNAVEYRKATSTLTAKPYEVHFTSISNDNPNAPMLPRPSALTRFAQSFFGSCACTAPINKHRKLKK